MKKLLVCFCAIFMATTLFVGCEFFAKIKEETYDKWYQLNTSKVKLPDIPLGEDDETSEASKTIAIAGLYAYYNEKDGMTLVVVQDENTTTDYLKPAFGKKLFSPSEFNSDKWLILVAAVLDECEEPTCISKPSLYTDISAVTDDIKEGIQWKKLLKETISTWLDL